MLAIRRIALFFLVEKKRIFATVNAAISKIRLVLNANKRGHVQDW